MSKPSRGKYQTSANIVNQYLDHLDHVQYGQHSDCDPGHIKTKLS